MKGVKQPDARVFGDGNHRCIFKQGFQRRSREPITAFLASSQCARIAAQKGQQLADGRCDVDFLGLRHLFPLWCRMINNIVFLGTKRQRARLVPRKESNRMVGQQDMMRNMAENDPKANLREQINENLKRVYEDVVNQEVPDRFKELLDKLRAIEKAAHEKAGGGKT